MRWTVWWQILFALRVSSLEQLLGPSICDDTSCHCDAFTRVVCNCTDGYDGVLFRPDGIFRMPPMVTAIIINGCARIEFRPETIKNLVRLRVIEIRNVPSVEIKERSLSWSPPNIKLDNTPGIRILIQNCTVNDIFSHAVQGRVNSIVIRDSYLRTVRPFAFSSLKGVTNIELTNNKFTIVGIQAFKQFTTTNFVLRGGHFSIIPSRFLTDVEVTSLFQMEGVRVLHLDSLAFKVSMPERVLIENNRIGILAGDAFSITTRGPITFRNNTVDIMTKGAFFGFKALREVTSVKGPQELLIDNNTMADVTPEMLMFKKTSLSLRVNELNMNTTCTCELVEKWSHIMRTQGGAINCWYELEGYFISLATFADIRCGKKKQTFWIFVVIGVIIIFLVAAIGLFFIMKREREKKKKGRIVMPDGKTYRETELHVVVERMELLTTNF